MSTQNKAIIRRLVEECWNKGNMNAADELISSDCQQHDPANPNTPPGPGGFRQLVTTYRGAFPDLRMTIDSQVAEGDQVVTRWTARGTHQGNLQGIPPSNRQATVTGIQIDRVVDGKVRESWANWDAAGLMQQIGAQPGAQAGAQRQARGDGQPHAQSPQRR